MNWCSEMAVVVPGYVRVGPLHVPVYGMFAAVGLVGALWLSQRTALRVGLSAEKLWDAGVVAVVAAFAASRVLLVMANLRSFVEAPLLVLALPSLTYAGMVVTGFVVWWYLRWKGMPWRDALDAWAPCAAVLAAVLQVGHFVEGTDAGMPTSVPWGVVTAGDSVLGKVHPVQVYGMLLAFWVVWVCMEGYRIRRYPLQVATSALIWGGLGAFFLDMFRQPVESYGDALLDPRQYVALACFVAGVVLRYQNYVPIPPPTRLEVAGIREDFVYGSGRPYAHEEVELAKFDDPLLLENQERLPFGNRSREQTDEALAYAKRLREDSDWLP